MADRALRGSRMGAMSFEDDRDVELAARMAVAYDCPDGHSIVVPMALEAEVPYRWECRECGAIALRRGVEIPAEKAGRHVRTHWDMLLERRSVAELEELLVERLELLHGPARTRRTA